MSQIVVDTDVASYIFNWHSLAEQYVNALRGSELILSFMSVAELRMGAMSAGWGATGDVCLSDLSIASNSSTPITTSAPFGQGYVPTREQLVRQSAHRTPGSPPPHWRWTRLSQQTTVAISSVSGISGCCRCDGQTWTGEEARPTPTAKRRAGRDRGARARCGCPNNSASARSRRRSRMPGRKPVPAGSRGCGTAR